MWLTGNWKKYCDELPPIGEEVIFYCKEWQIEDDFDNSTKVGVRTENNYIIISTFNSTKHITLFNKYTTLYINPKNLGKRLFWTHKPKYDE